MAGAHGPLWIETHILFVGDFLFRQQAQYYYLGNTHFFNSPLKGAICETIFTL